MLGPNQWAVLALLAEEPANERALDLAGRVELAVRQIVGGDAHGVDRALRVLTTLGLIEVAARDPGDVGDHLPYRATASGRAALREWLARPVEEVREINSLFLLKLACAQRAGLDVGPLLLAQREVLGRIVARLEDDLRQSVDDGSNVHLRLRLEIARTVVRFLDGLDPSHDLARP